MHQALSLFISSASTHKARLSFTLWSMSSTRRVWVRRLVAVRAGITGNWGNGLTLLIKAASEAFYHAFRRRFPKPTDEYLQLRM